MKIHKKKKKLFCFFVFGILAFFSSCSSIKSFEGTADFCGIVNDTQNNPVAGYRVRFTDFNLTPHEAITNTSGVFVFNDVHPGKCKISGEGKGWACFSDLEIDFYERSELFCIQVKPLSELTDDVYNALLLSDFNSAKKTLELVSSENSKDLHVFYMQSVTDFLSGDFKKSRKNLEKILSYKKKYPDFDSWSLFEDFYQLAKKKEKS